MWLLEETICWLNQCSQVFEEIRIRKPGYQGKLGSEVKMEDWKETRRESNRIRAKLTGDAGLKNVDAKISTARLARVGGAFHVAWRIRQAGIRRRFVIATKTFRSANKDMHAVSRLAQLFDRLHILPFILTNTALLRRENLTEGTGWYNTQVSYGFLDPRKNRRVYDSFSHLCNIQEVLLWRILGVKTKY